MFTKSTGFNTGSAGLYTVPESVQYGHFDWFFRFNFNQC